MLAPRRALPRHVHRLSLAARAVAVRPTVSATLLACALLAAVPRPGVAQNVSVTPEGTTVTRPSWTQQTQAFTVTNTGAAPGSFTIVTSCGGVYVTCTGGTTTQTIAAGASIPVSLAYETHGPPPGADWVRVRATVGSLADETTININVVAPNGSVAISPSTVSKPASVATSSSFTVTNTGAAASTYALSVTCTAPVTACSVPAPTSITLEAGASATVPVNYTPGAAGTSGTVTLTATTPGITRNATLTVNAAAATAGVTVEPKGQTVNRPSWTLPTQSYTVTNTGSASATFTIVKSCGGSHVTCSAAGQGGTSTQTIAAGATATIDFTYETHGPPPGTGWVRLSATGGGVSDEATTNVNAVAPGGEVAISPSTVSKPASVATSSSFTVTNTGAAASTYALSVACTAPVTACSVPAPTSITVAPGVSASVPVNYTPGGAGTSGTVTLTATTPGITRNATLTVNAAGTPAVSVALKTGPSRVATGSAGNNVTFTVTNTGAGSPPTQFVLSSVCSSGLTCPTSIPPVNLAGGQEADVTFAYTAGAATGANSIQLTATGGGASNTATYNVTVAPPFAVSVAPKNETARVTSGTSNNQYTFVVTNTGANAATFNITVACQGAVTCTAGNNPAPVTLAGGASQSFPITYTATDSWSSGTIKLTATGGGVTDNATYYVAVTPPAGVAAWVSPKNFPATYDPRTASITFVFMVQSGAAIGTPPVAFAMTASCTGLVSCSYQPTTVMIAGGDTVPVPVTFYPNSNSGGSGSIVSLTATPPSGAPNTGSVNVTLLANPSSVAVTPKYTQTTMQGNASGALLFYVTNTAPLGSPLKSFDLSTACTGEVTCTFVPRTVQLGGQDQMSITVGYTTSVTAGQGVVRLQAWSPDASDINYYVINVTGTSTPSVVVSPSNGNLQPSPGQTGNAAFSIQNNGGTTTSYTYTVTCPPAGVTGCTSLTAQTSTLSPGANYPVNVGFTAGAAGTSGDITLLARDNANSAITSTGRYGISVLGGPAIRVITSAVNPGTTVARDECLSISTGGGTAYECGDLRVVHPLPTTTTYGKARTPTLIYSSRTAKPSVMLAANVSLDPALTPTSIQGTVTFNNILSPTTTYTTPVGNYDWQPAWSNGSYRRISMQVNALSFGPPNTGLETGAYRYTFEVRATQNGVTSTATDTGTFVIVNRVNSPFGAGWWLAGFEQVIGLDANRILWIGGDASTRMYQRVLTGSGTMYVAENVDRPDSLASQTNSCAAACYYARLLPNKTRIDFNTLGLHVQTVNALGHVTSFGWDGAGKLTSITLPVPSGGLARAYGFEYGNDVSGVARLSAVRAPTVPGQDRSTYLTAPSGVVETIRFLASGPYADVVSFAHKPAESPSAPAARLMSSRTNRRGHVTSFLYNTGDGLQSATVEMSDYGAGTDIVHGFSPAETRGYPTPVRVDSAWTTWDGPRIDAPDVTRFLLNRFGAPDLVIGASNDTTTVTRDATWPALPATVTLPRPSATQPGLQTTATYDTRGRVLTSTQVNPLGDGVNATTTYTWDATYDKPTRVTAPMGEFTAATYRSDGRPDTKTSGGVTVTFDYTPPQFTQPCAGPTFVNYPDGTQDRIGYDGSCNVTSTLTPLNPGTQYSRDDIGRVVKVVTPIDQYGINWRSDTTEYDPSDLALRTRSFAGVDSVVTLNAYDDEGNLTSATQEAFPSIARRRAGATIGGVWVPNPPVGALTRSFGYDPAGRKASENAGGGFGWSMAYDPAGNVLQGKDLGSVTRTYDAKNRLLTQNGSDNATFVYDNAGRMTAADNQHAQVRRAYYASGALKEDTLRIVNPASPGDFTQHVYVTKYAYDRNGRPTQVTNHLGRSATYTYDPVTGNIKTILDVAGNRHRFRYDGMGRLDSLIRLSDRPDSVVQKNGYDLAGRLSTRYVVQSSSGQLPYYNESLTYDGRDKILLHTSYNQTTSYGPLTYTPLGQLATSNATKYPQGEVFETDGLGMHRWHTSSYKASANSSLTDFTEDSVYYTTGTTSVGMRVAWKTGGTTPDTTLSNYGALGNLAGTETIIHFDPDPSTPEVDPETGKRNQWGRERIVTYDYSNENRMVATTIRMDTIFVGMYRSLQYVATESYKYDALGRRIFVRSIKPVGCLVNDKNSGCHSFDNYTIWDGDQILGEVRTTPVGVSDAETNSGAPGQHYGTIEYTQAGVIDQPLAIARNDGAVILPYPDWSGMIDKATCAAGLCGSMSFPGSSASVYANYKQGSPNWYGSLTEGQTDASGFQYKRNRYYDPQSGTFTQDDPIGIAGGFNTYGYADGDPV
ncbi:MAG TPA: RHS repeat-associated core domain-containing protein, partial [Gemmatimonadaceae bacterium]|nr:RHS repeat-associated core domain-containing protein [Gemmatimonadaceae bacterium]